MGFDEGDVAEDNAARPIGDDAAGVEQDRSRAQSSSTISRSWVAINLVQASDWINPISRRLPCGVEVGGRLVENENRGIAGEHAGQARSI